MSRRFRARTGDVSAIEDLSFSVGEHEFVCVLGPSGCGKTTLLKLVAGLLRPTSGRIVFHPSGGRTRLRSRLVFQEHGVYPWLTVLDNVAFGLEALKVPRKERRERAQSFLERVGLGPFAASYPHQLSVGMRQRVGISRAFLTDPDLLLMDEPFGALDTLTRRDLQGQLLRLWRERRKVVLFVTHDVEEAIVLADRVLVMTARPGHIRESIPIPLERPRSLARSELVRITELKEHLWESLQEEAP